MFRLLALIPVAAILLGPVLFNQFEPLVFGFPLVLAWQIGCVLLTAAMMGLIYRLDPANRQAAREDQA